MASWDISSLLALTCSRCGPVGNEEVTFVTYQDIDWVSGRLVHKASKLKIEVIKGFVDFGNEIVPSTVVICGKQLEGRIDGWNAR